MHQPVDTSEHPIVVRDMARLDLSRRPSARPTEFWSRRHILEAVAEEQLTGLGAATELPTQLVA